MLAGQSFDVIPNHESALSSAPLGGLGHTTAPKRFEGEKDTKSACPRVREEKTNQRKIVSREVSRQLALLQSQDPHPG